MYLLFLLVFLVPSKSFACLNYLDIKNVAARKACAAANNGSFATCEHIKLPVCDDNLSPDCKCYDAIELASSVERIEAGKWAVSQDAAMKQADENKKQAYENEVKAQISALKELVSERIALKKANEK